MNQKNRRNLLRATSIGLVSGLAGCSFLSNSSGSEKDTGRQTTSEDGFSSSDTPKSTLSPTSTPTPTPVPTIDSEELTRSNRIESPRGSQGAAHYGGSLAVSNDGTTALVGASNYRIGVGHYGRGAVYVYKKVNQNWTQQAKLSPGNQNDRFGSSVDISSDGSKAVIGAMHDEVDDPEEAFAQGSVYIYEFANGGWNQVELLTVDSSDIGFGSDVAISGNGKRVLACDDGQVYAFEEDGDTWHQVETLARFIAEPTSVDLSEDGTVGVVSGTLYGENLEPTYYVEVYSRKDEDGWGLEGKLGELEGGRSAICTVSEDGDTILASSPFGESAYLYDRSGGWDPSTEIDTGGLNAPVELANNGNLAFVGVSSDSSGAIRVFQRRRDGWEEKMTIESPSNREARLFGSAIASSANGKVLLVGHTRGVGDPGLVYVF